MVLILHHLLPQSIRSHDCASLPLKPGARNTGTRLTLAFVGKVGDMVQVAANFIAAGGNRQPSAADWDQAGSGLLGYGAGNNIILWDPLVRRIS